MANNNLPKKLSFLDRLKMVFSGNLESTMQENSSLREQLAAYEAREAELTQREADLSHRETALEEEKTLLAQKQTDLSHRELQLEQAEHNVAARKKRLEQAEIDLGKLRAEANKTLANAQLLQSEGEHKIRAAGAIARERANAEAEARISRIQNAADQQVAQAQAEADAKVAEAEAKAATEIQKAEEKEAEYDKLLKGKISAGEITAEKGEQGAAMTIFFEQQIIQATEKLKADIALLESAGGNPEIKEKLIANYQANQLGSLLAYMGFDNITNPEIKKIIETKVQEAIVSIVEKHPEAKKAFIQSYIVTKYEAYDGKFIDSNGKVYTDLDSFVDNYGFNSNYFEGKTSQFEDPASLVSHSVSFYSSTKFDPSSHFLPRTDFSSVDFRIDPNLKVPQKSNSERPVSYSPDLASAVKRNMEGFDR